MKLIYFLLLLIFLHKRVFVYITIDSIVFSEVRKSPAMLVSQITHGIITCLHPVIFALRGRWLGGSITPCPTDGNGLTAVNAECCIGRDGYPKIRAR